MTFNDPNMGQRPPLDRPPLDRSSFERAEPTGYWSGWALAAVVAMLIMAGLVFYTASDRTPIASNPAAETTGRAERAPAPPAAPIPANPNAIQPQRDVPRDAPRAQ